MTKTNYWQEIVEFDPDSFLILRQYNTNERNLLSNVVDGMAIFNTDLQQIETYYEGVWVGGNISLGRVGTLAQLSALTTRPLMVWVDSATSNDDGLSAVNDGGGGWFYWVLNSNQNDNGTTVISPAGTPLGRYVAGTTMPKRLSTTDRNAITSPPAGLLNFNLTTNQYEYFDGSDWIAFSTASSIFAADLMPATPSTYNVGSSSSRWATMYGVTGNFIHISGDVVSTGSTTARTLQDRFANVKFVEDYGAAGDGTTDDSTAIQDALDAALASGSVVAFRGGKTYKITTTLLIPGDGITVQGNQAILSYTGTGVAVDFTLTNVSTTYPINVNLSDLIIQTTGVGSVGIRVRASRSAFTNVRISSNSNNAVGFLLVGDQTNQTGPYYNNFRNCEFHGNRTGGATGQLGFSFTISSAGTHYPNGNNFFGGRVSQSDTGLNVSGNGNQFYGIEVEATTTAMIFDVADSNTVYGGFFDSHTTAFSLTSNSARNRIDSFFVSNTVNAITDSGTSNYQNSIQQAASFPQGLTGAIDGGTLAISPSLSNYGGFLISSDSLSGFDGVASFAPNTVPGSGTKNYLYQFKSRTSGGTTISHVLINGRLGVGMSTGPVVDLHLGTSSVIGFDNGSGTPDTQILREQAKVISLRGAAYGFRVYNSYTDSSNYERAVLDWVTASNTLTIGAQALGTGTLRSIAFVGAGFSFSNPISFVSKSIIASPSDGYLLFTNNAGTGFTGVQFGGTSSSFPAFLVSGTTLQARLADNSAPVPMQFLSLRGSKTTNYQVTATDTLTGFDNLGSSGEVDFTLPSSANTLVGLRYTFVVGAAQILKIIANTGQTIYLGNLVTSSAGNIQSAIQGSTVELEAISTTVWVAMRSLGTWSVA